MEPTVIDRIAIIGHLGRYSLHTTLHERATLIHGPNGSMKTTLLHYLANVANLDLDALFEMRFERIKLTLSNAQEVKVVASRGKPDLGIYEKIRVEINGERLIEVSRGFDVVEVFPLVLEFYKRTGLKPSTYLPAFRTLLEASGGRGLGENNLSRGDLVYDRPEEKRLQQIESLKDAYIERPKPIHGWSLNSRMPVGRVEKTLFARTYFGAFIPVIDYPTLLDVERGLNRAVNRAKMTVAKHERAFLTRAIDEIATAALGESSYGVDQTPPTFNDFDEVLGRLRKVIDTSGALADVTRTVTRMRDRLALENTPPESLRIMRSFLRELRNLLMNIAGTMAPLEAFERSVNQFLEGKRISLTDVSYEDGILRHGRGRVILDDDRRIKLSQLSSGERHVLSLLSCAENHPGDGSLLIIDEPEISLHVDWQRRILPEIIARLAAAQVVVATHSPGVASSRQEDLAPYIVEPWNARPASGSQRDDYGDDDVLNELQ